MGTNERTDKHTPSHKSTGTVFETVCMLSFLLFVPSLGFHYRVGSSACLHSFTFVADCVTALDIVVTQSQSLRDYMTRCDPSQHWWEYCFAVTLVQYTRSNVISSCSVRGGRGLDNNARSEDLFPARDQLFSVKTPGCVIPLSKPAP